MKSKIQIFPDLQTLSRAAAEMFVGIGRATIEKNRRFAVALAGGSTPKSLYQLLAADLRQRLDWEKTFFFFGDERFVAPDADDSNFRMANDSLLAPLGISAANVFRWQIELSADADAVAEDYEQKLKSFFRISDDNFPRFDLILLGMGADGHTASLFPRTRALDENKSLAVANWVEKLNSQRLTLTFPTINHAANVVFLVAGADKAATLKQVLQGARQPEVLPSQNVQPENGNLFWLLDENSAARLDEFAS